MNSDWWESKGAPTVPHSGPCGRILLGLAAKPAAGQRLRQLRQLAQGGVLLMALVVPATAGLCLMTRPFVELTVSGSFQQATMVILPLAAIAGGIRNIRIHFADQVLILMERIDVGIWINVAEAVCVVGAWIGLQLGGLAGAVEDASSPPPSARRSALSISAKNSIFRCLGPTPVACSLRPPSC